MMENVSEGTYVLRCTCPREEHVCSNISISLPVNMTTFHELSLKGCSNCANSMVELALAIQENICQAETDRQVGLGMLGLANLLRRYGITYEQFGIALDDYNNGRKVRTPAYELVVALPLALIRRLELHVYTTWSVHLQSLLQRLVATAQRSGWVY